MTCTKIHCEVINMKPRPLLRFLCAAVVFAAIAPLAFGQELASQPSKVATAGASPIATSAAATPGPGTDTKKTTAPSARMHPMFVDILAARGLKSRPAMPSKNNGNTSKPVGVPFAMEPDGARRSADNEGVGPTLPLFTFRVRSSRDGNKYSGAMVGQNPFHEPGKTKVPTKVIPLIIKTQMIGTSFDPTTGIVTTQPGNATFDPTEADTQNACLTAPNNVATHLVKQSPIFTPTDFVFGGTDIGTTQYSDAFQRANFWNALGKDKRDYHVLLDPVEFLDPITLEVPAEYGLAITNLLFFGPPPSCAPLG